MATGSYLSIIALKVNGLNAPTKRQRLAEWIQKQDPYICYLQESESESESKVTQSCPTLCDPMGHSLLGACIHGILHSRILEWVAFPFSRDLPGPGIEPESPALQADSLLSEPPGKPK